MASLIRPTRATYTINENITVDTTDREDHSFSGILFPIKCKDILPVNHIVIKSIGVRGGLGPITVWVSKQDDENSTSTTSTSTSTSATINNNAHHADTVLTATARRNHNNNNRYNLRERRAKGALSMNQKQWTKIYEKEHNPSYREYEPLDISDNPIIIKSGEVRGIYIHSSIDDDSGIVYDNQQKIKTYDDKFISVLPGRAHVSTTVFGTTPIWGGGNAWRDHREFVGRISYGVVYDLWNPTENLRFGNGFRHLALTLFGCQRRAASPLCLLPDECIFYILNMCRWDWVDDTFDNVRGHRKKLRLKSFNDEVAAMAAAAAAAAPAASTSAPTSTCTITTTSASMCTTTEKDSNENSETEVEMDRKMSTSETTTTTHDNDESNDEIDIEMEDTEEEGDVILESDSDEDFEGSSSDDDEVGGGGVVPAFNYNIYDDYASAGEEEEREEQRLRTEREARRRWMTLHHWNLGDTLNFFAAGHYDDDGDNDSDEDYSEEVEEDE